MLAITRYVVAVEEADSFLVRSRAALAAFAERPGHEWGTVARSTDDPTVWTLTTRWENIGTYRRALGSYAVKAHAHPLMFLAVNEQSAFEELLVSDSSGLIVELGSDRAADADTSDVGDALDRGR